MTRKDYEKGFYDCCAAVYALYMSLNFYFSEKETKKEKEKKKTKQMKSSGCKSGGLFLSSLKMMLF